MNPPGFDHRESLFCRDSTSRISLQSYTEAKKQSALGRYRALLNECYADGVLFLSFLSYSGRNGHFKSVEAGVPSPSRFVNNNKAALMTTHCFGAVT